MAKQEDSKSCEQCNGPPPGTWFCASCDTVFCDKCWESQIPHRKGKRGPTGVAHEKSDWKIAKRLEDILTPTADPVKQQQLHKEDVDTAWFGVVRHSNALPGLQDYGRYSKLMQASFTGEWPERWPQLCSFVGQTGDGKSTLIKMLIDQQLQANGASKDSEFPTPVVGSIDSNTPTSGDVHLYADPDSFYSQFPRLYADCEGLKGGEATPLGDRSKVLNGQAEPTKGYLETMSRPKLFRKAWDIRWADGPMTKRREFAVRHLYPRFMYTFSNVVVFVLRNERTFEATALKNLLEWASRSIEGSINQPSLPHAIIALNACDHSVPDQEWDVDISTKKLLSAMDQSLETNPALSRYINFWNQRGRAISSTLDLLKCYYSSFRVVRIPAKGRYMLIDGQVKRLSQEIKGCCIESHRAKVKQRLNLTADDLADFFHSGFAHFSVTLDQPFDFVELSWNLNPIPQGFAGNILRLALAIKESDQHMTGPRIFEHLSSMVASCVMLDYVRHRIKGTTEQLLRHYRPSLDRALDEFCDAWWPCSYRLRNKACVNVYRGHSKGHQDSSGKLFGNGIYHSSFTADGYRATWHQMLTNNLERLRKKTERVSLKGNGTKEQEAASEYHLQQMNGFYQNFDNIERFSNHSACFCCLRELPEHPLPCGHVLCTPCVHAFGKPIAGNTWVLDRCPLHRRDRGGWNIKIVTKPRFAGLRILTLDGGGMRGIVELQVLAAIERRLGGLPIQSFLDLIVGTSTGGIIALGLGVKGWSAQECIRRFRELCDSAFTPREFSGIPMLEQLSTLHHQAKYKSKPLEQGLMESFGDESLFGGTYYGQRTALKVAVTATTEAGQGPLILTNYNRPQLERVPYKFERPERIAAEFKIWEAARATSAAPPYFKHFTNSRTNKVYLDGALYHNNPIGVADVERKLLWSDVEDMPPDLLLSIGTGRNRDVLEHERKQHERKNSQMPRSSIGGDSIVDTQHKVLGIKLPRFLKVLKDRMQNILNAQEAWEQFYRTAPGDFKRYVRINPDIAHLPALDEAHKLETLETEIKDVLRRRQWVGKIEDVVQRLIASCFYFDKTIVPTTSMEGVVLGSIRCRFEDDPHKLKELARRLRNYKVAEFSPFFTLTEIHDSDIGLTKMIPLPDHVLDDMKRKEKFDLGEEIQISSPLQHTQTMITMCFDRDKNHVPISGFPRKFGSEDESYSLREKTRQAALRSRLSQNYASSQNTPRSAEFPPESIPELEASKPLRSSWSGPDTLRPESCLTDTTRSISDGSGLSGRSPLSSCDSSGSAANDVTPSTRNMFTSASFSTAQVHEPRTSLDIGSNGPFRLSSAPRYRHISQLVELDDTSKSPRPRPPPYTEKSLPPEPRISKGSLDTPVNGGFF